jgi:ERCC4-type nuclease
MITGIFVDSREPEWVQKLQFGSIPAIVSFLEHGDVMAATDDGAMILVERKTPSDFLGSLRDERLLPQLAEMLDQTRWSYLVVTGEFQRGQDGKVIADGRDTGWSWSAVQGALLTIQEMGIFVTFAGGDSDYEQCILRIGNRDRKPDLLLAPPKMPRILSAQEAIIASLPGIGTDRLEKVMSFCGTPAWALVALTDKDSEIPGVGRAVKSRIRAAFKLGDNEMIGIFTLDETTQLVKEISNVPTGN